jgi:ubiquinone/menaquinone biosynthesis C-methylase UbiE
MAAMGNRNLDEAVVESFGREWRKFDQAGVSEEHLRRIFEDYFDIFPWEKLPANAVGFDLGCGTGRWAHFVAPRVGELHCIDPSEALEVARRKLAAFPNCRFHRAGVDAIPLPDDGADFGYSLGVLHHVPDTEQGIADCVRKLKPGAPFLLYLYYAFDNRPRWFRTLWKVSDLVRRAISRSPHWFKSAFAETAAALVYFPLARLAAWRERRGHSVDNWPLAAYRHRTFYVMRNDALDRFGTRLEKRFTRAQIETMMRAAGLEQIRFSNTIFWCALGLKKR